MTALTNLSPAASYGDLITCTNNGQGLTASLQYIQDGLGNNSAIQLSTNTVNVVGTFQINGNIYATTTTVTVPLTSANITGMYAAPVLMLAAPGAGNAYQIFGYSINYTYSTAAYTAGGNISLQYGNTAHAGAGVITGTIPVTAFNSATNTYSYAAGTGTVVTGTQSYVNTGIYISNTNSGGGAFATGSGTASVTIYYSIVAAV